MKTSFKALLAILSGILVSLSFPIYLFGWRAPEMGWIIWIALVPLFVAIRYSSPRGAFVLGLVSSFIWYLSSLFWAIHAMYVFGGMSLGASIPVMVLMVLVVSIYIALTAMIAVWIKDRWRGEFIVLLPVLWIASEFCRNYFPCGGFPWSNIAMSQWRMTLLIQIVDLVGVYGFMFLIVWVNVFISDCVLRLRGTNVRFFLPKFVVTVMLVFLTIGYGYWRMPEIFNVMDESRNISVALLQGNIPQDEKWDPAKFKDNINAYRRLVGRLRLTPVDLIVWPEASIPTYVTDTASQLDPAIIGMGEDAIGPLPLTFLGIITSTENEHYHNSAILVTVGGKILSRYHKAHLTPFGEYVPYKKLLFFAKKLTQPVGDFLPGNTHKPIDAAGSYNFGALICYEDIFPEISRESVLQGADLLVNVTNNAWFGETSAPYQQLALSVFRAVENRRYLVRSTNTGISAVISPIGNLVVESGMFESAVIVANVGLLDIMTPYTKLGDWFAWACVFYAVLCILAVIVVRIKRRRT